jgi:hypothetical protein
MKSMLRILSVPLLLGVMTSTASLAQQAVNSAPLGFLTLQLQQGSNHVGFSLQPLAVMDALADVGAPDRTRVFLREPAEITNQQFGAGTHVLEFLVPGSAEGFHSLILNSLQAGNEIRLAESVPSGVANGSKVRVWKLWTLADVFGAGGQAGLAGGATPEEADLVMLPSGSEFLRYYYSTGGDQGTGWRQVGTSGDKGGVVIPFAAGFMIHTTGERSLALMGQVKTGKTRVTLQTGRNYLANLCPVAGTEESLPAHGRTLGNSGLEAFLTAGRVSALADLVLFWDGSGYQQYYYSSGGPMGVGWRRVGGAGVDQAATPIPAGGFAIQRRGAPISILMSSGF